MGYTAPGDMTIIGWRAWYTGGRVFESTSTRWDQLPKRGVICFRLYHKTRPYSRIMIGVSLYWHVPAAEIYACDNREDALIPDDLDPKWIKEGKWVGDQEYIDTEAKMAAATEAPDESLRVDKPRRR